MKKALFASYCSIVLVISLLASTSQAATSWKNNGQTYTLDSSNPSGGGRITSYDPLKTTIVNLLDGGYIGDNLDIVDNGQLNIYGGTVNRVDAHGTGHVNMYGGGVSQDIVLGGESTIVIYGSDFKMNDVPLAYGTYHKEDFSLYYDTSYWDYYGGLLTGTLKNNDPLNNQLLFFHNISAPSNATLVLVPEPMTLSLLILGGLIAIKHKPDHKNSM